MGRKVMDSIYSGDDTFWISGMIALFILPLVTLFEPVIRDLAARCEHIVGKSEAAECHQVNA